MIFGRDTLPASHFEKKKQMNIDVSLSKMIIFVQGKGVSGVSVTDPDGNKLEPTQGGQCDMKYPTNGAGDKYEGKCKTDESLQGVMLTFEDCKGSEGEYKLNYSGEASSAEVYYEPDVNMVFTFTDENGNEVKPEELYEGDYVISYGMMDAQTAKYTPSTPHR